MREIKKQWSVKYACMIAAAVAGNREAIEQVGKSKRASMCILAAQQGFLDACELAYLKGREL